jgi:organic radical activating enzyme
MNRIIIPKLDTHVADSCNLKCEQCDHFSNYLFTKVHSYDKIKEWCEPWSKRIIPQSFHILGGEPLMNRDIVRILYLIRELWPESNIILWSNGLLLKNFPDLPIALKETNTRLHISNHSTQNSKEYDRKFNECIELLKSWYEKHEPSITFQFNDGTHLEFGKRENQYVILENKVDAGPDGTLWERFYHGYGKNIKPFKDGNPELSWTNCSAKCPQLYNGRIHKCAPLTFLPLMNQKFGLSEEWSHYLTYKGIEPSCSEEELCEFLDRVSESYCGMCPTKRPKFVSIHNPLKVEDKSIL